MVDRVFPAQQSIVVNHTMCIYALRVVELQDLMQGSEESVKLAERLQ